MGLDGTCYAAPMHGYRLSVYLLVLMVAGCRSEAPSNAPGQAQPEQSRVRIATGAFDYYLLNLSWSPEYCYTHSSAAECAAHDAFVLHGLWPENNDGTYPENCSNAAGPENPAQYSDLYPDAGLLQHEWKTHGTCSGLSGDEFFATARAAYESVKIPSALAKLKTQTSMQPEQILDLFTQTNPLIPRASFALSCGHNFLTAVEICLDKSLHPVPCSGVQSCRANTVRIPAP